MLSAGEFNLSSVPEYTNSPEDVLKKTMIGQELVFRKQVYELHRLYEMQKNLTDDSGYEELDAYNYWKERLQTPVRPFTYSMHYAALAEGKLSRNLTVSSTVSLNKERSSHSIVSSRDDVDLTLRIGGSTRKKGHVKEKACYEKTFPLFPYCVDLEASTDRDDRKIISALNYATPVTGSKQNYRVKTDVSHAKRNYSIVYGGKSFEENLFNLGCNELYSGISSSATTLKGALITSNESLKFDFDLNKVQSEDSLDLNDPADICQSIPGPCSPDKLKGICSDEASCSYAISCEKVNSDYLNEPSVITLARIVPEENLADACDVEITTTLEQNVTILQPCKNKTKLEDLNSNMIYSTTRSVEKMNEESAEGNDLVEIAAESLLRFSLGSSVSNQVYSTSTGINQIENEGSDRPQCSLDSYESLVLKLEETSADDYCVSSKAFEVDESDRKERGVMWKRGRRLKDFQKDILPNLVSLSRHEIREDVGIMEAVMRSREYKRMRSKAVDGENWFTPTKCKRSRSHRRYS